MKRSYVSHSSLCAKKSGKNILKLLLILFILNSGMLWIHNQRAYAAGVSPQAVAVYGQGGSFTTATTGITSTTLNSPRAIAVDSSGNSYIADYTNNRVLYYLSGSTTASRVYGQGGSFTSNTANFGGVVSANSLNSPFDVTLDSGGNLYIADAVNNRVLYYAAGSTTATRVYGQGGSFTSNTVNLGGVVSANGLNSPNTIGLDSSGNLYITDAGNNRVLYYAAGSTTATRVYGQGGSFSSNTANLGGVSANSLSDPESPELDSSGNLYIGDEANNRVLFYAAGSTTATRVYGQGGSFSSNTANFGGISATSLSASRGVKVDNSNNVYIDDFGNNRALYYPAGSTTATHVYGQGGSFTTNAVNNGGVVSAASLSSPLRSSIDSSGNLYMIDMSNNRVLKFQTRLNVTSQPPASTATNSSFSTSASLVDVGSSSVFTDLTGTVSVAIKPGTGTTGATLGGTTSTSAVSGVATFSNLSINTSGTGYILTMSSTGVVSGNSSAFTITTVLTSPQAIMVYGQGGNFTTNTSGTTTTTLNGPRKVIEDSSGDLYVSECSNNRVLYYAAGSSTATRVYGQGGSFTTGGANTGGVSANSLYCPTGLALDGTGDLYVGDDSNNRVLYYAVGSTTATRVYGQGGSFTTNAINTVSATSLNNPNQIGLDSSSDLYVADLGNDRVLYYAVGSTTATRVYGQGGSFTANTVNNGGISATSLYLPEGIALDSSGNLYVTEYYNNRVLYYPSGSTTATQVYGQGGSFTTNTANKGGVSANSLSMPTDVTVDSGGNLYVADYGNNRVFYYPSGSTTATRVYGQGGSFTTNTVNNGGESATSLNTPYGVTVDSSGSLYVTDESNNRVLKFQTALSVTSQPAAGVGATSSFSTSASLVDVGSSGVFTDFTGAVSVSIEAGTGTSGAVLSGTIPVSAVSGVVTFSDLSINLPGAGYILTTSSPGVGSANTTAFAIAAAIVASPQAITVYGQAGSFTTSTVNNGGISATSSSVPRGSILDSSGDLYVADYSNNRVLYYAAGSTTATRVYGQGGSFTTNTVNNGGISANSLYNPIGLALDSSGNLYISDNNNNRVLYYAAGSTTATRVYGQGGIFTTGTADKGGVSANSLNSPNGIALDSGGNLYVTEYNNHRVLYYAAGSTTATRVYGQGGSFTTGTLNNGGISATSLSGVTGVALDSSDNLYVGDPTNNRVLYYPTGTTTATRVYGQGGSFTTGTANNGGISTSSLYGPCGLDLDSNGNLYIADTNNNRVLYYPAGTTTATRVYGQGGIFTTNTVNDGGTSATSLSAPFSLTVDSSSNIYIVDMNNNRTLKFQTSLSITTQPPANMAAQTAFFTNAALIDVGSGTTFSDFSGTVAVAIKAGSGPGGAVLSGTTSIVASSGTVTFSNLSINLNGNGYILTLSSSGVGSANTNAFGLLTPAGYWKFDDGSGTSASDSSGNNDAGTITGAAWTTGKVNGALSFSGTTNYVSMGTPTALKFGTGSFTVMSWFKTTGTVMGRMVSMGVSSYSTGFDLGVNTSGTCSTGCVGAELGGGSKANTVSFGTTATTFNNGNWHQAAMVIDQVANTAQLYVDGVVQALSIQTGTCGTVAGNSVNIAACNSASATNSTDPFTVGNYRSAGGTTAYPFTGSLDEVRVYGSALSSAQIQSQYGIDTMPSPSGYWPFDENSGTTANDSSSNLNNGTLTSGPTWTAGEINSGLSFNGSSNYVTMGTPSTLEFNNSSFTVASWFNSTATLHNRFVGSGLASYGAGFELGLNTICTGCVGGDLGANGTAANTVPFATTTTFNDGNWHQAIMVIDQTAKTAQIYVDGVAQPLSKLYCGTVSGTSINFSACASVNTYSTTEPFVVGAYKGTGGFNEGFSGSLDEVHVYGSALSSAQALNLYTNDSNALSEYAANATFSGTVGTTVIYTLPISLAYQLTPAPGWNLSITSTTLTSGANTLPTTGSTITSVAGFCSASGTCSSNLLTNTISSFPMTLPAGTTAPTAVKFLGTIAGSGTGAYTVTATISVNIPAIAKTGTYTSTITLTAANGP